MTSGPSTEELLVQVLLRFAHEALATATDPDEPDPRHARALTELTLAFASLWSRLPRLALDVAPGGIRWRGAVVLSPEDDEAGLGEMLAQSGIVGIALDPGVETEEMQRLLEVLDRKRRLDVDGDLDLVTMLFREDFQHVEYTLAQADADAAATPAPPAQPPPTEAAREIRSAVREEAGPPERRRGIVELEKFDSTLYFLDEKEIQYLRGAIDREYAQDHARNVLALLLDILELRSEPAVRDEVLHILRTLMPYLLGTGRFESVAYLTAEIRGLKRSVDFAPAHLDTLEELRVGVSETRALAQLFHALDAGELEADAAKLGVLLGELRPEAVRTVLVWVGQLNSPRAKSALVDAIEAYFARWPTAMGLMLEATDRTVVHRALGIAKKLRLAEFVDPVVGALDSDDATTRRLAARALASIGSAPAIRGLLRLIDDPDGEVRRLVLEALSARPFRGAQERLGEAIESRDVEGRGLGERRALFEAYGVVAGTGGVATLEPILFGKGALGRRASSETRACAAVALGVIGTPAARFALEKAAKDRDPVVRSAASSALRGEP